MTIPWGYAYTCSNITANDNYPLTIFSYSSLFLTNNTLFSISNSGLINFSAPKSAIGNHVVRITVYDDSKCSNNMYSQDYNISIFDANHPPYLATMIPNASISNGTSVSYYLNDYFKGPGLRLRQLLGGHVLQQDLPHLAEDVPRDLPSSHREAGRRRRAQAREAGTPSPPRPCRSACPAHRSSARNIWVRSAPSGISPPISAQVQDQVQVQIIIYVHLIGDAQDGLIAISATRPLLNAGIIMPATRTII